MKKKLLSIALIASLVLGTTGCGGKSFDVMSTAEISFSGYSGQAVCTLEGEYDWVDDVMDWYGDTITDKERKAAERELKTTVTYEVEPSKNLSNGDVVTITANIDKSAAEGYAFQLIGEEITVTVEGLAAYVESISDIPEDMLNKMKAQADDIIKSNCEGWDNENSLASSEYLGSYCLSVKEGFSANPNNRICLVYKNTANMTGLLESAFANGDDSTYSGAEEYYTYVYFENVIILPDGTPSVDLSAARVCPYECNSDYGYYTWLGTRNYTFNGYKDLDSMFSDCVTKNIEKYNYENTVS